MKLLKTNKKICTWTVLLISIVILATPAHLQARNNIRSAFFDNYPDAVGTTIEDVNSQPTHCGVCHYEFTGGGPRNLYGQRLETALGGFPSNPNGRRQAVASIENEDPDGDGYSTLIEVTDVNTFSNTPTFPGLTPSNVGSVTSVDVTEIQTHLIPSAGGDTTPPTVAVIVPNGGETYTANTGTTIEWIAGDVSGIAIIDLYVSLDNGVTYKAIELGLSNSGTYEWFPANRPTTQALFQSTGNLHLAKPFRLEEVDQVIRRVLELHGEGVGERPTG